MKIDGSLHIIKSMIFVTEMKHVLLKVEKIIIFIVTNIRGGTTHSFIRSMFKDLCPFVLQFVKTRNKIIIPTSVTFIDSNKELAYTLSSLASFEVQSSFDTDFLQRLLSLMDLKGHHLADAPPYLLISPLLGAGYSG
jgi:hypothetical protein